jgi:hypothetical protein
VSSSAPSVTSESELLNVHPGEWVFYAFDSGSNGYFFKAPSVKAFEGHAAYTTRFTLKTSSPSSSENKSTQGAYEDDYTVLECSKPIFAIAEKTVYNSGGDILFHYKFGDAETLDASRKQPFNSGSILGASQRLFCDEQTRARLLSVPALDTNQLSYLSNTVNGDGTIFYGAINPIPDGVYNFEVYFVTKFFEDRRIAELFPNKTVLGLPPWTYRTNAQDVRIDCDARKVLAPVLEYYNAQAQLVYVQATTSDQPLDIKGGSIFDSLITIACAKRAKSVDGNYEGVNEVKYDKEGEGEQRITVFIEQRGGDIMVKFESPTGGRGEGTGALKNNRVEAISLHSTAPDCPGSYDGSLTFNFDSVSWTYAGQDCAGSMNGHGTAKKIAR